MKKYIFIYYDGNVSVDSNEKANVMKSWMAWFDSIKEHVVDIGFPTMNNIKSVDSNGSTNNTGAITGYSVLKANSMEDVIKLVSSCPQISAGGRVDIYEEMSLS